MTERDAELSEQAEAFADREFKGEINWSEAYESKLIELVRADERRRITNLMLYMQKLVGSGAPVVLPPHPPHDQGADYERGFVERRSWEVQTRANKFKPDWNTEAVLVEEMQRMGKRIDDLEMLLQVRAEQIVGLQDEIRNLTGEE